MFFKYFQKMVETCIFYNLNVNVCNDIVIVLCGKIIVVLYTLELNKKKDFTFFSRK
jgi:hypothetical protein